MALNNSSGGIYIPTTLGSSSFRIKHKGDSVFYKKFDGSSSETVDILNNSILIENHFFKTGEKLKYTFPRSGNKLGISTTSPGNSISTSFMPDEVYAIVVDSNNIKLSFTKNLALSGTNLDIISLGVGNNHGFEGEKQNSRSLIVLDNIIQAPLSAGNTVGIVTYINSQNIVLSDLTNINVGTVLKIGNELTKITNISYSNTNVGVGTVSLLRGVTVLGTPLVPFSTSTKYATIMNGQYNIVQDKIYFTDAPFEGKRFTYKIPLSDVFDSTDSFNLFNTDIKTGSRLLLVSQNPPLGLQSNKVYFAIKNYENNFSFANSYEDAINEVKISFDKTTGQYDQLTPVLPFDLTFFNFSFGSKFNGRVFLRSNYDGNKVFDDFSNQFNGISSSFELKYSGLSTSGISSDNGIVLVNNIFQYPEFEESFSFVEEGGKTFLNFIGIGTTGDGTKSYDVNVKGLPRGGIIVGYALSSGTNYQPLKSAVLYETSKIESDGVYTINNDNIGIAYSGSGYRYAPGYATSVSFEQNGTRISGYGTAIISSGYITSINIVGPCTYTGISTPIIKIDPPLEYDNLSPVGVTSGIGAKINLTISDSGKIDNFKFTNPGYGYSSGDVLTLPNLVGYSTQIDSEKLEIVVLSVGKDTFSAWNIGKLRKLDDLSPEVNGTRRSFNLKENGQLLSLESLPGSDIEISQNVLVFLNDVIQVPEESYYFNGGTQIIMSEAPPTGSTLKVYFYEGSDGDSFLYDIDPRIKVGDNLVVEKNISKLPDNQNIRTVKKIVSSDSLNTEIYNDKGLSYDSFTYRPVNFTPQSKDLFIGGELISKSRDSLASKYVGFTSVATLTAGFTTTYATSLGITTSGIQVNDYIESDYTSSYKIVSIGSSTIGLSTSATNATTGNYTVRIWRKI
jgi:hypothetical protein